LISRCSNVAGEEELLSR